MIEWGSGLSISLKIFAQLIGISTPPSKRKNKQVAMCPPDLAENDGADENQQKDKAQ